MRVFLGSSREAKDAMREVADWLEDDGHEIYPWDSPSLFIPGDYTFSALVKISKQVDAAVFIFSEDDKVWYRDSISTQPRDNVLIEYGLFAATLGQQRAIFCIKGKPKNASDIQGITHIDLNRPHLARRKVLAWIRNFKARNEDVELRKLNKTVNRLERRIDELQRKLEFYQQTSEQLQNMVSKEGLIDFHSYDFRTDAHWKLLFNYEYFWGVVLAFHNRFSSPQEWRNELERRGETWNIIDKIGWDHVKDIQRAKHFIAKSLRVFRQLPPSNYILFLERIDDPLHEYIDSFGRRCAERLGKN